MKTTIQTALRVGLVTLGLSLLVSCGDEDAVGVAGRKRNFHSGTGFDLVVSHIEPALDGSGDMYVSGGFTRYNGATANRMVRVNRDGSLDTGFDVGAGFPDYLGDIAPIGDTASDATESV